MVILHFGLTQEVLDWIDCQPTEPDGGCHKAKQGPTLADVRQVLKRMPDRLQRDADYWIGKALEELFTEGK